MVRSTPEAHGHIEESEYLNKIEVLFKRRKGRKNCYCKGNQRYLLQGKTMQILVIFPPR